MSGSPLVAAEAMQTIATAFVAQANLLLDQWYPSKRKAAKACHSLRFSKGFMSESRML